MQGLVSYSDDEEDLQPRLLPRPPSSSSSSTRPVPSDGLSTLASSSKSSLRTQLPNLIRRPAAPSVHAGPSRGASSVPPSPLRRPVDPSPDSTPDRWQPPDPFGSADEDEAASIRALLRPPALSNGEGWEEEYGLKRLAEEARFMTREVDPGLQHKVSTFLSLKAQGTHFNDSLMKSRAFRNPTIYKKLVEFVDVDERRGLSPGIWEWEDGERDEWTTAKIADKQKERSERLAASQEGGKRDRIGFTSSSSSHRPPPSSSSSSSRAGHPPPIPRTALPAALAPVPSGGKAYSLVGVGGDDLDLAGLAGKRSRGRDKESERRDRKREKTNGASSSSLHAPF